MKPKRSCPGVPKRYNFTSSSMVIQPKSRATVVVVFSGTWPVRSMSAPTDVIAASVRSGGISEMAPTAVVFPTPKPPAITILTGVGGRREPATGSADCFESTNDPFDHAKVLGRFGVGAPDDDVAERGEVGHEDLRHTDVQAEHGGNFGHRLRDAAQVDDVPAFEREVQLGRGAE